MLQDFQPSDNEQLWWHMRAVGLWQADGDDLTMWQLDCVTSWPCDEMTGHMQIRLQCSTELQSSSRYRATIPGTTHSCRWHTWSTSTSLCLHRSPGSTLFQTFHHRRPSFSGCRLRSGTHYQTQSFRHQHCGRSSTNWKLFYFNDPLSISTVIVVSQ